MKATWSLLAVYENDQSREHAVRFCDELVSKFWNEVEFRIDWRALGELRPGSGNRDGPVTPPDLVVFAIGSGGEPPLETRVWAEEFLVRQPACEGAIVGLTPGSLNAGEVCLADLWLRKLAHRAGMDYLTGMPESILRSFPDSAECCQERATQVSDVLAAILSQQPPHRPRI